MYTVKSNAEFISDLRALDGRLKNIRLSSIEIERKDLKVRYNFICDTAVDESLQNKILQEAEKITSPAFSCVEISVKKIVSILLDNAVKHADPCGEILVTLKKENGKTVLTVFNSGSFVPTEDSNKVFERFYRGDSSRSRESGGSGLGLSIAKSIADINKWKINAVSIPEVSMTVTVVFN